MNYDRNLPGKTFWASPKYLPALLAHCLLDRSASETQWDMGKSMEGRRKSPRVWLSLLLSLPSSSSSFPLLPSLPTFPFLSLSLHPSALPSPFYDCVFRTVTPSSSRSLLESSSSYPPSCCQAVSTEVLAYARLPSFWDLVTLPPPRIQWILEKEAASCYG